MPLLERDIYPKSGKFSATKSIFSVPKRISINMANIASYSLDNLDNPNLINIESNLKRAAFLISQATSLYVCTGAGMSVDAGIPDYRGPGNAQTKSQWASDPEIETLYGITTAQKSEGGWFIKDPTAAWGYETNFMKHIAHCVPHEGYHSLHRIMNERFPLSHFVFTSNIDGMHMRSGLSPALYYPCYGSIFEGNDVSKIRIQCSYYGTRCSSIEDTNTCSGDLAGVRSVSWDSIAVDQDTGRAQLKTVPICRTCQRPARLNLLFFKDKWCNTDFIMGSKTNNRTNHMHYLKKCTGKQTTNLVVLEIGAGNHIPTIRRRVCSVVRKTMLAGGTATVIRINLFQSLPEQDDLKYDIVNGIQAATDKKTAEETTGETKKKLVAKLGTREFISLPMSAKDALCRIEELLKTMAPPQEFVEQVEKENNQVDKIVVSSVATDNTDDSDQYQYFSCSSASDGGGGSDSEDDDD